MRVEARLLENSGTVLLGATLCVPDLQQAMAFYGDGLGQVLVSEGI